MLNFVSIFRIRISTCIYNSSDPRFYSVIIPAFGKFGSEELVEEYFNKAEKDNALTLKCFLGYLYLSQKDQDAEKAWGAFEKAYKLGFKPDQFFKNVLESIVYQYGSDELIKKMKEHEGLKVLSANQVEDGSERKVPVDMSD